jgi:hypothetical protein
MDGKYALAIGVRKSGSLPTLDGAIADAHAFAEWASNPKHGYDVRLVTDEGGPLTIERLRTTIDAILEETVSRLLIFYSGHGICSQLGDYWLLSKYDRDGEEAVNVLLSMRNARRLGIGQIAVFSDACRSSLNRAAFISGRVIFPSPRRGTTISPYDEFLSTDIGDASQEVPDEDPSKSYGVFSRCVLAALRGMEPEAAEDRAPRKVISSGSLANWLEKTVPFQSGKIPGGIVQNPSITPSWRCPNDEYAEYPVLREEATVLRRMGETGRRVLDWTVRGGESLGLSDRRARRAKAQARVAQSTSDRERKIRERSLAFQAQRGRESFETHQGLTVVGSTITEVVVPQGTNVDLFTENVLPHVRGYGGPHSIALKTDQKFWIAATLLPEFIGTLVVNQSGVESLNYAPPRSSPNRDANLRSEKVVADWNALLSVDRRTKPRDWEGFAEEVRQMKHINPAFGILAAYAYERSGMIDEIANIGWYFASRNNFVPFDVMALLRAYGDPDAMIRAQGDWNLNQIVVAGGFPALTQGWSLLDVESGASSELVRLRAGLMDSVWTTFDEQTGRRFADMIERGEI